MNEQFITYHDNDNNINILNIKYIVACANENKNKNIYSIILFKKLAKYNILSKETPEKLFKKITELGNNDFIKLHLPNNKVVIINKRFIIDCTKEKNKTKISIDSNTLNYIYVIEPIEKIIELIN